MLFDWIPLFREPAFADGSGLTWDFYALLIFVLVFMFVGVYFVRRTGRDHSMVAFGLFLATWAFIIGGMVIFAPGVSLLILLVILLSNFASWLAGKGE